MHAAGRGKIAAARFFYGSTAQTRRLAGEWIFRQMRMQILKVYWRQMPQMAEKTEPDAPPNCAVLPYIYFFICCSAAFSSRETCAWEMPISSATSIWVFP